MILILDSVASMDFKIREKAQSFALVHILQKSLYVL